MGWAGLGRVATPVRMLYSERNFYYMALCRILKALLGTFNKYFHSKYIFLSLPIIIFVKI